MDGSEWKSMKNITGITKGKNSLSLSTSLFVGKVFAVIFAIADPVLRHAQSVSALELFRSAVLLRSCISKMTKRVINKQANHLSPLQQPTKLTTMRLVGEVATVVVPVAEPLLGDALAGGRASNRSLSVAGLVEVGTLVVLAVQLVVGVFAVHL